LALERRQRVHRPQHLVDHLPVRPVRVQAAHQGHDAGHVRRGHRRAAHGGVEAVRLGAEDAHAGGGQVDRGGAVVGERRQVVLAVGGGDGDDVVRLVVGGVEVGAVVVGAVVAGGGDEDVPLAAGVLDGGGQGRLVAVAAPAVVRDRRPV